jgi:hypothetical protein
MRRWLAVIRARGPVTRVLLAEGHVDLKVQQAIARVAAATTALLADYLAARIADGQLRPVAPAAAARMLLHALFGLSAVCADAPDAEPEAVLDLELDILLHGLLAPDERTTGAETNDAARAMGR